VFDWTITLTTSSFRLSPKDLTVRVRATTYDEALTRAIAEMERRRPGVQVFRNLRLVREDAPTSAAGQAGVLLDSLRRRFGRVLEVGDPRPDSPSHITLTGPEQFPSRYRIVGRIEQPQEAE
jgi:hypothetical protein